MASRSSPELVSLAACTASSFILPSIALTSLSAPSAVCITEIPSAEFCDARSRDLICVRILLEIEKPAASSAAAFILYPDERRSVLFESFLSTLLRFVFALSAEILLFILIFYPHFLLSDAKNF